MKNNRFNLFIATVLIAFAAIASNDITFQNNMFSLTIGENGIVKSLIYKPDEIECLQTDVEAPMCVITQYRPYDNENFLMFPAKPRSFPSNKCYMSGDTLMVEFTDTYDIAKIKVDIRPSYIAFRLIDRDYRIEDYGVKRKTELDEFTILQLPLIKRERFGEWLNVMWDDSVAVALMGTDPTTFVDSRIERDNTTLMASTHAAVKLYDSGAALMVSHPDSLLNCIDDLEVDYNMPRGVESRRHPDYKKSYYELRNVTVDNIDRNIELAKQAGLHTMVIYYVDFAKACGHYEWRPEFPNGMEDLKTITRKISDAGLIPGIHIHYSKIAVNDPYINNGKPDRRGNIVKRFTLASQIGENDTLIFVEEYPEGVRMEDGRRLLQIDDELIMFTGYSNDRPYCFTGCSRGFYNSAKQHHDKGDEALHLDVDDWPLFIRVNQDTEIQHEIAERLGKIYAECGFKFVYFDGAEDVPMPYWYNVSRSQLEVYNAMKPAPLWAEGAQKSHYGWHILSRGNAFDIFPPERIRQAMKRYTLRCAEQVACDFTSVNFGWVNYSAPSDKSIGMQPDMFDYICSKALAWDSPISLIANVPEIDKHNRTDDNMLAINLWETAKINNSFDKDLKIAMRDPSREWTIIPGHNGKSVSVKEVFQVTSDSLNAIIPVRAFSYKIDENSTAFIYWDIKGASSFKLNIDKKHVSLKSFATGKNIRLTTDQDGNVIIPAGERRILILSHPMSDATEIFINAIVNTCHSNCP